MSNEIQLTEQELHAAAVKLSEIRGFDILGINGAVAVQVHKAEITRFMQVVQAIDYAKGEL
jgi:hypothetical protein